MVCDTSKHHRRSIRLKHYDYSQADAYFITICTYKKQHLLGEIIDGIMNLNEFGEIVEKEWLKSAEIRKNIELDAYAIMPNHLHGIIIICRGEPMARLTENHSKYENEPKAISKPNTIGSIIGQFKSVVTKKLKNKLSNWGWQRNYYEHIIRDEKDLERIRKYIEMNALNWQYDIENPNDISEKEKKKFWKNFS